MNRSAAPDDREGGSDRDVPGDEELAAWLRSGRSHGFLGPGPVAHHVDHALGMADAVTTVPHRVLDLGAGGGVPGLVLARSIWPAAAWTLLDAGLRRTTFLCEAVAALGLDKRVDVVHGRAEDLARRDDLRHSFDLVVARSFGAPAVTAECGAPFLAMGGLLLVSEPPDAATDRRWSADGLVELGLVIASTSGAPASTISLRSIGPCGERFPRRVGVPQKRPLF